MSAIIPKDLGRDQLTGLSRDRSIAKGKSASVPILIAELQNLLGQIKPDLVLANLRIVDCDPSLLR